MPESAFCVAVLPFLKTSGPVRIGGHLFRSTADVTDLPPEQAKAVTEIAEMLFLHGDIRVRSASYAIIRSLELNGPSERRKRLAHLRAALCYIYAAPRDSFDDVFLSPDEISLVLFIPGGVPLLLTRPEHHSESVSVGPRPTPDARGDVPGFNGLYNFRHYFWLERGSRLYGPKPYMALNISQNLQRDLQNWSQVRLDFRLLLALLEKPLTPATLRVFTALEWFRLANQEGLDPDRSILNLAIAFEALLRLPDSSKTERLVDAIALLLGRTERLDDWAEQFYAARSRVAHEGSLQDPYFYSPASAKQRNASGLFGSLMLYGRQIFQLCLSTLLVGIDLAERADLQEKFVTNNERYQRICELLKADRGTPSERLLSIESTLVALERYHFVATGSFSTVTLIGAARTAAATLLACDLAQPQVLVSSLQGAAQSERQDGELAQLAALELLSQTFSEVEAKDLSAEAGLVQRLVKVVWSTLFQRYYWLKESSPSKREPSVDGAALRTSIPPDPPV